jgi:hypothetical protein
MSVLITPTHRMYIGRRGIRPIIVNVVPTVEVNEYPIVHHILDRRHTHQRRVLPVDSFQLHPDPEPVGTDRLQPTTVKTELLQRFYAHISGPVGEQMFRCRR